MNKNTVPPVAAPKAAAPAVAAPKQVTTGGIRSLIRTTVAQMVSYARQGVGMSFGQHPSLIDDCLRRALINAQTFIGSGNQALDAHDPSSVVHPSIVGMNDLAGSTYQVTVTFNAIAKQWEVATDAAVTWSVLVLTQQGTAA